MAVATAPSGITITGLRCRECGQPEQLGLFHVCSFCFGPLEVVYDTDAIAARVTRERIAAGPLSLWRYADMLPVLADDGVRIDLGTGFSPTRPAPRLARRLGLKDLWLKDDTRNPSGSFKDRVVTIALSPGDLHVRVRVDGQPRQCRVGARGRVGRAHVRVHPHDLERGKVVGSAVYGANVVAVDGNYDDVNRLAAEVADETGWGFVNVNLRAYYAEGSKSIGFEIAEQLGWQLPDHVVVPVASGSQLTKIHKAFQDARDYGLVWGATPRISGAQATGCAPVANAFERGSLDIRPVRPDTIARSLAIGNPADGYYALQVANQTGGVIGHFSDDEIVAGIRLLAETEGIFAETAGGVTVANLRRFVEDGTISPDERTVAIVSGNGYKTIEAVTDEVGPTFEVSPSLDDFLAHLG